jgi:magnesium transporter
MPIRAIAASQSGAIETVDPLKLDASTDNNQWVWVDLDTSDSDHLEHLGSLLDLSETALQNALEDDLARFGDYGNHILVVLHGIAASDQGELETFEIDCFLTGNSLVTMRADVSSSIDSLFTKLVESQALGAGGPDELLARLADVMMRRWVSVISAIDVATDVLVERALQAHPAVLREITHLRSEIGALRRISRHHTAVVSELAKTESELVTRQGRRRLSDVIDIASRVDHDIEAVRVDLKDALDSYRGAESRKATEVSKVLTIYAAVMLPLTLIVGFFGMNFAELPGLTGNGWKWTVASMIVLTVGSLAVFASVGWISPPSQRTRTKVVTQILSEASRAPTKIVGSLYSSLQIKDQLIDETESE